MINFYHTTSKENIQSIAATGLNSGTYFTISDSILDYYKETIEDDGNTPIVLVVSESCAPMNTMEPDWCGIDEPICGALGRSETEIWNAWSNSTKDAQASLEIIGTCKSTTVTPPQVLMVLDSDDLVPLDTYAIRLNRRLGL